MKNTKEKIEEIEKVGNILVDLIHSIRVDHNIPKSLIECDYEVAMKALTSLIEQEREEAVEEFREFCRNEVPEKRLSNDHYVLVGLLMDAYISSLKEIKG